MNLPSKQKLAVLLLVIAGVLGLSAISNSNNTNSSDKQAQSQTQGEENKDEDKSDEEKQEDKTSSDSTETYSYVAQRNDSYTKLARKAVQTYSAKNKIDLSQAQIIYAETLITQKAGSPALRQGQEVTLNESTVKSWVEKAEKLSDSAKKAWGAYTAGVDFNTDKVGQSS